MDILAMYARISCDASKVIDYNQLRIDALHVVIVSDKLRDCPVIDIEVDADSAFTTSVFEGFRYWIVWFFIRW